MGSEREISQSMTVIFYLVFASDGFTNKVFSLNICHWDSAWRASDAKCCETIKLTTYPCTLIPETSRTVAFHQNFSACIICDNIIVFFSATLFPTSGSLLQMTDVWTSNFTLYSLLQCLAPLVWEKEIPPLAINMLCFIKYVL